MEEFKPRKSAGDLVAESRIESASPDEISEEAASGAALVVDVREPDGEQSAETVVTAPYDVGDVVGDFGLPTLDGGEGRLSDYRGKVILLVFTATWCPYCGVEAPFLEQEIWQRFQGRGVQVIAIDVKEPPEVMRPFRDRYGWTFPVWLDRTGELIPRFAPEKEFLPPEVAIINAHFVLDADGRVRYREYLNMEGFDARARTVASELEKVLEQS